MNNTVIQENSGINSFYAKVYSLVGMGIGICLGFDVNNISRCDLFSNNGE